MGGTPLVAGYGILQNEEIPKWSALGIFPTYTQSDAVIFFGVFNLIAQPSSFENHVAVSHFLVGAVITDTGTYSMAL